MQNVKSFRIIHSLLQQGSTVTSTSSQNGNQDIYTSSESSLSHGTRNSSNVTLPSYSQRSEVFNNVSHMADSPFSTLTRSSSIASTESEHRFSSPSMVRAEDVQPFTSPHENRSPYTQQSSPFINHTGQSSNESELYLLRNEISTLKKAMENDNLKLQQLHQKLTDKDRIIHEHSLILKEKEDHIVSQDRHVQEQQSQIHEKDLIIRDKEAQINALQNALSDKDVSNEQNSKVVNNLRTSIADKDIIIRDKETAMSEKDLIIKELVDTIQQLESSLSKLNSEKMSVEDNLTQVKKMAELASPNVHKDDQLNKELQELRTQLQKEKENYLNLSNTFDQCKISYNQLLEEYNRAVDYIKQIQNKNDDHDHKGRESNQISDQGRDHGPIDHVETSDKHSESFKDGDNESYQKLRSEYDALKEELDKTKAELKKILKDQKEAQAHTAANMASLDKMKQQLLREKAELSRKLSMDSGNTEKRYNALLGEIETIQAKYNEQIDTIKRLMNEKSELNLMLQAEVEKNSLLLQTLVKKNIVHEAFEPQQNIDVTHDISNQESQSEENNETLTAPDSPIREKLDEPQDSDKLVSNEMHLEPTSPIISSISPTIEETLQQDSPTPHLEPLTYSNPKVIEEEFVQSTPVSSPQKSGWASSLPLFGRFMGTPSNNSPTQRH